MVSRLPLNEANWQKMIDESPLGDVEDRRGETAEDITPDQARLAYEFARTTDAPDDVVKRLREKYEKIAGRNADEVLGAYDFWGRANSTPMSELEKLFPGITESLKIDVPMPKRKK